MKKQHILNISTYVFFSKRESKTETETETEAETERERQRERERERERERKSTKIIKLALTGKPNYKSNFLKYATTLYNQAAKQIQQAQNYCNVFLKLKKYLFNKTLARSLSD